MPKQRKSNQNVVIAKGHMLLTIEGVQLIKNRYSVNMWWTTKKLCLHFKVKFGPRLHNPRVDTFSFTADQLVKFVATVAIQIAQPQMCYTNAPKDAADKKSSAKSQLGISISGSILFDTIGNVHATVLPASKIPVVIPEPFHFSASTKPSAIKPSTILNSLSPPPPPPPAAFLTRLSPNSLTLPNRTSLVGHLS